MRNYYLWKTTTAEKEGIRRNYEEKLDELRNKMEQLVMMSSNSTKRMSKKVKIGRLMNYCVYFQKQW